MQHLKIQFRKFKKPKNLKTKWDPRFLKHSKKIYSAYICIHRGQFKFAISFSSFPEMRNKDDLSNGWGWQSQKSFNVVVKNHLILGVLYYVNYLIFSFDQILNFRYTVACRNPKFWWFGLWHVLISAAGAFMNMALNRTFGLVL